MAHTSVHELFLPWKETGVRSEFRYDMSLQLAKYIDPNIADESNIPSAIVGSFSSWLYITKLVTIAVTMTENVMAAIALLAMFLNKSLPELEFNPPITALSSSLMCTQSGQTKNMA
mmetsp:Transcript_5476/g.7708  ORF Transcript_5476/g.7708 Transcript_5476/m.7708 type:complete len:116 (-) Transcript_5476:629-976(-)